METVVLGIDIGTTSVAIVAVGESGRIHGVKTRQHKADVQGLQNGYFEQDPHRLLSCTLKLLSEIAESCRHQNSGILCIGITGQMHSVLLLDESNEPVSNVITWQDQRSLKALSGGKTIHDDLIERTNTADMSSTGCHLAPGYMGTTLFAIEQLQQWPDRCVRVSFVADWVASRLCNTNPVTDRSHAASSGLFDLQNDTWSEPLLKAANVRNEWLPTVLESDCFIGSLSSEVTLRAGLPAGIAVCNSIGDNQAAVLSSLPDDDQSLLINIGTGGQIAWRIRQFTRIANLDTRYLPSGKRLPSNDSGNLMLVGAGLCGGEAIVWLNQTVRKWLAEFGIIKSEEQVWHQITECLNSDFPPAMDTDDRRVKCEPFFSGTRFAPQQRAVFSRIDRDNFTIANIARSIFTGIADSMKHTYSSAVQSGRGELRQIVMSGNAARMNPELVEAVQKAFATPAKISPMAEEAAVGAALIAGVSSDLWPDLESARILICSAAESR